MQELRASSTNRWGKSMPAMWYKSCKIGVASRPNIDYSYKSTSRANYDWSSNVQLCPSQEGRNEGGKLLNQGKQPGSVLAASSFKHAKCVTAFRHGQGISTTRMHGKDFKHSALCAVRTTTHTPMMGKSRICISLWFMVDTEDCRRRE
mmetsp:Transcript_16343/g.45292  ORF Transcript_16343/g.45292 Transcript_16343/m.45292 type:complete len:148 (+) Transcript_16343:1277-1720(+)